MSELVSHFTQIEKIARRFHEVYFGHLLENSHISEKNNYAYDSATWSRHRASLLFAVEILVNEGLIKIGK